jgi:flagellar motor switch protein FliM
VSEKILSQDEVDALLKGVADGTIPADAGSGAGRGVRTLDLTSQERSLRGRAPNLEVALDRFVRAARGTLGSFLGRIPEVSLAGLELVKFATVTARLARPVGLQLFRMPPLRGQGMVVVTPELAAMLLEAVCGGQPGRRTPLAAREFSAIEQRMLERLGARVLEDLREAWRPLAAIEFGLLRSETNPALAPIAAPQELVLTIDLAVAGEGAGLTFCLPDAALDPIRHRLHANPTDESEAPASVWSERLRALVGAADLELTAELGTRRMRVSEVLALRAGDVLALPTGREGPVLVRVEGRPRFLGAPGVAGSSNAVRITARL